MYTNQTPPYLSTLVPPSVNTYSEYSLRNSNDTQTVHARTTLYYNSFLPSTVREWNNLSLECRNSESVSSFKHSINESSVIVPKYYNSGNRRFQILHTRLRTNCSALNNDLFLKRICDSPYCRCGAIENAFHFFLNCPQYARQRADLIHNVSQHIDWLCWGLTTRQPLRVILCRLPEKGRKETEERVEEMKERDREERGTGMKVKKQKK